MGWKSVKDHYRIEHIVQLEDEWSRFEHKRTGDKLLCIGSPYVRDLISVNLTTWEFRKALSGPLGGELQRYWDEIHADLDLFRRLVAQPDTFTVSIPVYMFDYESQDVVELLCEQPGWPHVTHCGRIMHENDYFLTRAEAVIDAAKQLESSLTYMEDDFQRRSKELADFAARIDSKKGALIRLKEEAAGVSRETQT